MSHMSFDWVSRSTALRSALRKAGVLHFATAARGLLGQSAYEARVDEALVSRIRPGHCVWDVGANVGLYTQRFAEAVGPQGRVVAFEPIATTFEALSRAVSRFDNVQSFPMALGATQGELRIALQSDPTSPTNSLSQQPSTVEAPTQLVRIETGDDVIRTMGAPPPEVLKIDTEGFEEEVLWGLRDTLRSESLKTVLIEMHFALLEARGLRRAPERISSFLRDAGFELRWVDPSHLLGTRPL